MERHYAEEEPNSAPQFVVHSPQPSPFPPRHNDKYFVDKDGQTQWTTETGPPFIAGDAAEPKKKTRRWTWILVGLGVFVIVVVAAVVGGVLGSRAAHKNDNAQSDSALSSTPSASSLSGTNTTTPSTTISNNPTSTTTNPPSSTTSSNSNTQSANNGTARLAVFDMYETDSCGGTDDSFAITSTGSQRCVPVPSNKRSIRVTDNSSCIITTWSGGDCKGLSFRVPDTDCHSVLYSAVSVYC
ncbi:hypothetical protein CNMCM7691_007287 [Aspergillus felis]|uniref:Uncharacterized protein n=1 Tax=Aspergillus felis TaxID=1287682 RepID=A0A8H6QN76_9EURO|nr:hypothetical protein CNMCM7691_007287 [Aspergillus felis]